MSSTVDALNIQISADVGNAAQNISQVVGSLNQLEGSAKSADTDMSSLVKAMTDAANGMMSVSQSISQSASGMSGFQNGADASSQALTGLNSRFDTLNASVQQSYAAFESAAASVGSLGSASEASASAMGSIVSATDGFASRMSELQTNTQGTSDSMSSLQRELQETLANVRGFSDNMSSAGRDALDASEKIRQLSEQVRSLPTQQPSLLAAGFKNLKGIVATLGIGKFIKDSNDAYVVQMQNELKLTAHMKQRMNATDAEIQSIKDLASAQQQIGVIGDEIQLAGAQQLTTYASQSSTLKTLIPAMNNLIAQNAGYEASVGDATSAADMLGRALNGQYTSLKRMGVTFSEAQENVLKYGTEEQKAAVLADAINSKVGNMNQLLASTPTGRLKQLQNDFGDLQEQLGATFQPFISSIVPVARGVLETLAPPIVNISKGIVTIGSAIASVDSPAVRGIALAAAGLAVINTLRFAIGGTSAGLLLLGVAIAGIIGGMQEHQESIGDIASDAYNSAAKATENAANAVSDYNDELGETKKAVSRLAGFDTITKLSGNSSTGTLVSALLGTNGIGDLEDAAAAAGDLQNVLSGMSMPEFEEGSIRRFANEFDANMERIGNTGEFFARNLAYVFTHLGDDEAIYGPLNSMTNKIESILNAVGLDGTGFVNFWKGVGSDIYEAMAGGDSQIYKALNELDDVWFEHFGRWKIGAIDVASVIGKSLYMITNADEIVKSGQADEYIQELIKEIPDGFIGKDIFSALYTNTGLQEKLQSVSKPEDFSLREFQMILQEKLREGLSSEDAFKYAKSAYISTDQARTWLNKYVSPSDRTWFEDVTSTEVMRMQMIQSGEIKNNTSQSSAPSIRPVPSTPSGMPSYVFNAYFNGELRTADDTSITNGRDR